VKTYVIAILAMLCSIHQQSTNIHRYWKPTDHRRLHSTKTSWKCNLKNDMSKL